MLMNQLFPVIEPYKAEYLKVSNIHNLYLEQSGNPEGIPIVVLHGGPGSYSKPYHRQFYDPQKYRIILFDQRGCGKSTPLSELKENTTWDLVEDIEKIRKYLKINKWIVVGPSWGSTLALSYSEKYPEVVKTLLLQGIYTFRKSENDWINGQVKLFYPEVWENFINSIGLKNEKDIEKYLIELSQSKDTKKLAQATKAYGVFNNYLMRVIPENDNNSDISAKDLAEFKIFFHYVKNNGFFKENQLLKNAYKIKNIPTVIIQGRQDMCCPPITAWELKKQLPQAEIVFVDGAGHKSSEPDLIDKIIQYTNKFSNS